MEPMKCKQLVTGDPHFVGIMDAAQEGTWGVVVTDMDKCVLKGFPLKWPQNIQDLVCTEDNPERPVKDSDLEMAGVLL